jgi:hypothetical protein
MVRCSVPSRILKLSYHPVKISSPGANPPRNPGVAEAIPPNSLAISSGMELIDLPLRTAFSPAHPLARYDSPLTLMSARSSLNLY